MGRNVCTQNFYFFSFRERKGCLQTSPADIFWVGWGKRRMRSSPMQAPLSPASAPTGAAAGGKQTDRKSSSRLLSAKCQQFPPPASSFFQRRKEREGEEEREEEAIYRFLSELLPPPPPSRSLPLLRRPAGERVPSSPLPPFGSGTKKDPLLPSLSPLVELISSSLSLRHCIFRI